MFLLLQPSSRVKNIHQEMLKLLSHISSCPQMECTNTTRLSFLGPHLYANSTHKPTMKNMYYSVQINRLYLCGLNVTFSPSPPPPQRTVPSSSKFWVLNEKRTKLSTIQSSILVLSAGLFLLAGIILFQLYQIFCLSSCDFKSTCTCNNDENKPGKGKKN